MMTATRPGDFDLVRRDPDALGLRAEVGHAVMRRLRRAAFLLLDLRTEFDALAPGDVFEPRPRGPLAELGLAVARRARRAASIALDPWTEFASLD